MAPPLSKLAGAAVKAAAKEAAEKKKRKVLCHVVWTVCCAALCLHFVWLGVGTFVHLL